MESHSSTILIIIPSSIIEGEIDSQLRGGPTCPFCQDKAHPPPSSQETLSSFQPPRDLIMMRPNHSLHDLPRQPAGQGPWLAAAAPDQLKLWATRAFFFLLCLN